MVEKLSKEEAIEFEPKLAQGFERIKAGTAERVHSRIFTSLTMFKAELAGEEDEGAIGFYVANPNEHRDAWAYLFIRPKTVGRAAQYDVYETFAAYTEPCHRANGYNKALHSLALEHLKKPLASDEKGMTEAAHALWIGENRLWTTALLTQSTGIIGPVPSQVGTYFHRDYGKELDDPKYWLFRDTVLLLFLPDHPIECIAALGPPKSRK